MPLEVVFNFNTGSDTQASGAPANMSPIFGNNASWTSGSATIDLSADNPDLTNVPTDGSAAIWFESASGRNVAQIIGKNNTLKTVTVPSGNYPDTTGTGRWAIGGKRKSFDDPQSRRVIEYSMWTVYSETDQTISDTLNINVNDYGEWFGGPPNGNITITLTNDVNAINVETISPAFGLVRNVTLKCIAPTKTNCIAVRCAIRRGVALHNVTIGPDPSSGFWKGAMFSGFGYLSNVAICHCIDHAIHQETWDSLVLHDCVCANNGNHAIMTSHYASQIIRNSIIAFNNGHGAFLYTSGSHIMDNVFYGNAQSGMYVDATPYTLQILNNIFAANGRYGVELKNPYNPYGHSDTKNGHNCYWNNASGARLNFPAFPGDLLVDPQFKDPANLDFTVGPNLKAMGWPPSTRGIGHDQSNTRNYSYIGPAQPKQRPVPQRPVLVGVPDNAY
ncbi:MAG: hypothetical protein KatS3mg038_1787 [Candidatus Kapaibacterium sp.]|nr:MAG: hypothetical protein KatS3mg038_1787 [Candidatus Kapabacteria bacterium]